MGLKRDNRYRQSVGKLLELTKQQHVDRTEWQANRQLDWTDLTILTMGKWSHSDGIMSWGFCRVFDVELGKFTHFDMPGSMRLNRVLGQSNVVRTDTTDRMARAGHSRRVAKNNLLEG